jgi:hypothetical protein
MPMTNFTQEQYQPSDETLNIIRQIAYSFNGSVAQEKSVDGFYAN